jgi:AbiJ N-terminal domain 4
LNFSERHGHQPIRATLQFEEMDDRLRIGLWNNLDLSYWEDVDWAYLHSDALAMPFIQCLYIKLGWPINSISQHGHHIYAGLGSHFLKSEWHQRYSFLEYVVACSPVPWSDRRDYFKLLSNLTLEKEMSAWRFIGDQIGPITDEVEIEAIESATSGLHSSSSVRIHLAAAVKHLLDRDHPDFRNSIKESMSAVEAMCNSITGEKLTLGKSLSKLENRFNLHQALGRGFSSLYGYASDSGGIRHALTDAPPTFEDAKLMLVFCSGFVNYLEAKAARERN